MSRFLVRVHAQTNPLNVSYKVMYPKVTLLRSGAAVALMHHLPSTTRLRDICCQ